MDLVAYDERQRPYLALAAVVGVALLGAIIGAAAILLWHSTSAGADATSPQRPGACPELRADADTVLQDARRLEAALATQTRVMNDLLAHRVALDKALAQALPALTRGTQQSLQLDQDARAYSSVASQCSTP
jgi:hypothetical protein